MHAFFVLRISWQRSDLRSWNFAYVAKRYIYEVTEVNFESKQASKQTKNKKKNNNNKQKKKQKKPKKNQKKKQKQITTFDHFYIKNSIFYQNCHFFYKENMLNILLYKRFLQNASVTS